MGSAYAYVHESFKVATKKSKTEKDKTITRRKINLRYMSMWRNQHNTVYHSYVQSTDKAIIVYSYKWTLRMHAYIYTH